MRLPHRNQSRSLLSEPADESEYCAELRLHERARRKSSEDRTVFILLPREDSNAVLLPQVARQVR